MKQTNRDKLSRHYHILGHVYDFSNTYPKFDGKTIAKKERLVAMFKYLLEQIGYRFEPITRPMPAILMNWQFIDRKFLCNWMNTCCQQLVTIPAELIRLSYLDIDGFCLRYKNGHSSRIVSLRLTADGYDYQTTTTIELSTKIVQRFMSVNFKNKIIIIN